MARIVGRGHGDRADLRRGPAGTVTAADLQPEMLAGVKRRAEKAGLAPRASGFIRCGRVRSFDGVFDFVLAFWMVP